MFYFQLIGPHQQRKCTPQQVYCKTPSALSGTAAQWVCPRPSCLWDISASLLWFVHYKPTQRPHTLRPGTNSSAQHFVICSSRLIKEAEKNCLHSWCKLSDPVRLQKGSCEGEQTIAAVAFWNITYFTNTDVRVFSHFFLPSFLTAHNIAMLQLWFEKG